MLFDPSLLGLFKFAAYSSLNDSIWSLVSYSYYFGPIYIYIYIITLLVGFFVPFISSWASLAHLLSLDIFSPFSNSAFLWVFTNSLRLSGPNYLILHPWGSWVFHQPFNFFTCITSGLLWPILTFLHHILPMSLLIFSPGSFRLVCFLNAHLFIL